METINRMQRDIHTQHCNQGEYIGSCKYGEVDKCTALNNNKTDAQIAAEAYWNIKKLPLSQSDMYAEVDWDSSQAQEVVEKWCKSDFIEGWKANPATWTDEDMLKIAGMIVSLCGIELTDTAIKSIKKWLVEYKKEKDEDKIST